VMPTVAWPSVRKRAARRVRRMDVVVFWNRGDEPVNVTIAPGLDGELHPGDSIQLRPEITAARPLSQVLDGLWSQSLVPSWPRPGGGRDRLRVVLPTSGSAC
jgi:hypothetical protein